jgi:hypothetical protein
MFRSRPKRAIAWLVGLLGAPPPPPHRHFSKMRDARVRQRLRLAVTAPGATRKIQSPDRLGGQGAIKHSVTII